MTRRKTMTCAEIIKGLECHGKCICDECPYSGIDECADCLNFDVIELVKRQMEDLRRKNTMLESALEENLLLSRGIMPAKSILHERIWEESQKLRKESKILRKNAAEAFQEGLNEKRELFTKEILKEFAHFLIDRAEGGVIPICDLPDLVIDFKTKENER